MTKPFPTGWLFERAEVGATCWREVGYFSGCVQEESKVVAGGATVCEDAAEVVAAEGGGVFVVHGGGGEGGGGGGGKVALADSARGERSSDGFEEVRGLGGDYFGSVASFADFDGGVRG